MRNLVKLLPLFTLMIFGCSSDDSNPQPEALHWEKVVVGSAHMLAIRSDGTLWAWGDNQYGQVGDGTTTNRLAPVQIGIDNDWASITAGQLCSAALKDNGHLYTWGINEFGNIGNGSFDDQHTPLQIGTDTWTKISFTHGSAAGLKSDGTIWAWGNNEGLQVGGGSTDAYVNVPTQIGTASDWIDIDMGMFHALAKKANGDLYGWGNSSCALGNGATESAQTPQLVTAGTTANWMKLSSTSHTLGLKSNGKLFGAGINSFGSLGIPDVDDWICEFEQLGNDTWTMADAGIFASAAIKVDGTLWVWGYNSYLGQLGFVDEVNLPTPTQLGTANNWKFVDIGGWYNAALTNDNQLWCWGRVATMQVGQADGPFAPYLVACPQ